MQAHVRPLYIASSRARPRARYWLASRPRSHLRLCAHSHLFDLTARCPNGSEKQSNHNFSASSDPHHPNDKICDMFSETKAWHIFWDNTWHVYCDTSWNVFWLNILSIDIVSHMFSDRISSMSSKDISGIRLCSLEITISDKSWGNESGITSDIIFWHVFQHNTWHTVSCGNLSNMSDIISCGSARFLQCLLRAWALHVPARFCHLHQRVSSQKERYCPTLSTST